MKARLSFTSSSSPSPTTTPQTSSPRMKDNTKISRRNSSSTAGTGSISQTSSSSSSSSSSDSSGAQNHKHFDTVPASLPPPSSSLSVQNKQADATTTTATRVFPKNDEVEIIIESDVTMMLSKDEREENNRKIENDDDKDRTNISQEEVSSNVTTTTNDVTIDVSNISSVPAADKINNKSNSRNSANSNSMSSYLRSFFISPSSNITTDDSNNKKNGVTRNNSNNNNVSSSFIQINKNGAGTNDGTGNGNQNNLVPVAPYSKASPHYCDAANSKKKMKKKKKPRRIPISKQPTTLMNHLLDHDWDSAQNRAISHPDEVRTWIKLAIGSSDDGSGQAIYTKILPLHRLCYSIDVTHPSHGPPPLSLFEALVNSYPQSASFTDSLLDRLPIHTLCFRAGGVSYKDKNIGDSSSSTACTIVQVMHCLLNAYPEGAVVAAGYDRLPLHFLCMSSSSSASPTPLINEQTKQHQQQKMTSHQNALTMCVTMLLSFGFAAAEHPDNYGWLPLHAACIFNAPTPLLQKLVEVFPEAVLKRTKRGAMPLDCIRCENAGTERGGAQTKRYVFKNGEDNARLLMNAMTQQNQQLIQEKEKCLTEQESKNHINNINNERNNTSHKNDVGNSRTTKKEKSRGGNWFWNNNSNAATSQKAEQGKKLDIATDDSQDSTQTKKQQQQHHSDASMGNSATTNATIGKQQEMGMPNQDQTDNDKQSNLTQEELENNRREKMTSISSWMVEQSARNLYEKLRKSDSERALEAAGKVEYESIVTHEESGSMVEEVYSDFKNVTKTKSSTSPPSCYSNRISAPPTAVSCSSGTVTQSPRKNNIRKNDNKATTSQPQEEQNAFFSTLANTFDVPLEHVRHPTSSPRGRKSRYPRSSSANNDNKNSNPFDVFLAKHSAQPDQQLLHNDRHFHSLGYDNIASLSNVQHVSESPSQNALSSTVLEPSALSYPLATPFEDDDSHDTNETNTMPPLESYKQPYLRAPSSAPLKQQPNQLVQENHYPLQGRSRSMDSSSSETTIRTNNTIDENSNNNCNTSNDRPNNHNISQKIKKSQEARAISTSLPNAPPSYPLSNNHRNTQNPFSDTNLANIRMKGRIKERMVIHQQQQKNHYQQQQQELHSLESLNQSQPQQQQQCSILPLSSQPKPEVSINQDTMDSSNINHIKNRSNNTTTEASNNTTSNQEIHSPLSSSPPSSTQSQPAQQQQRPSSPPMPPMDERFLMLLGSQDRKTIRLGEEVQNSQHYHHQQQQHEMMAVLQEQFHQQQQQQYLQQQMLLQQQQQQTHWLQQQPIQTKQQHLPEHSRNHSSFGKQNQQQREQIPSPASHEALSYINNNSSHSPLKSHNQCASTTHSSYHIRQHQQKLMTNNTMPSNLVSKTVVDADNVVSSRVGYQADVTVGTSIVPPLTYGLSSSATATSTDLETTNNPIKDSEDLLHWV